MEKWEEFYTKNHLAFLQQIELENLRVFIEVCRKLNLEYVIYGGTLLGAEKYGGFIPWDDDIDVALPRSSYDRFVKEAPAILPSGYMIQSPYSCKKSPYPYAKMRKIGTKYIEYVNRNIDIESGIYIDIYPIDRIPDDEQLRKKQFRKVQKWLLIYVFRQSRLYDKKENGLSGFVRTLGKWCVCNGLKIFPQEYCVGKIDHYMTQYNHIETKRYAALNSPNYNNIYLHLYPFSKGTFNGIDVFLPGDYKTHLRMRYGDFDKMPEESARFGHVPYKLDFGAENEGRI